jgi:hypothetical protein
LAELASAFLPGQLAEPARRLSPARSFPWRFNARYSKNRGVLSTITAPAFHSDLGNEASRPKREELVLFQFRLVDWIVPPVDHPVVSSFARCAVAVMNR